MDTQIARERRHARERVAGERFCRGTLVGAPAAPVENLWKRHQVGAAGSCQTHQPLRALKISALVRPRGHLNCSGEVRHRGFPLTKLVTSGSAWSIRRFVSANSGSIAACVVADLRDHNPNRKLAVMRFILNTEEPRDRRRAT